MLATAEVELTRWKICVAATAAKKGVDGGTIRRIVYLLLVWLWMMF
jgi:hypothetical protein